MSPPVTFCPSAVVCVVSSFLALVDSRIEIVVCPVPSFPPEFNTVVVVGNVVCFVATELFGIGVELALSEISCAYSVLDKGFVFSPACAVVG